MKRQIIQVSIAHAISPDYDRTIVVALCNDGTVWEGERADRQPYWVKAPPIPPSEDDD